MKSVDPDLKFLARALELARRGEGHTRPNPPVGAVVVSRGKIIGEGWHHQAGMPHAEVEALQNAVRRGNKTKGATIYVTLEPCSKPGRVGACTDAIKAAGIARVVYASVDPNPKNRGGAKRILTRAGVACQSLADLLKGAKRSPEAEALQSELAALIRPFEKFMRTGLPYLTVKIAMTLDGRICDDRGDAKWVSSEKARRTTGKMRERVDAIMVGAWTIRKDNPCLLSHGKPNDDLLRVVVSRSGRLPHKAQVFTDGRNPTLVYRDAREAVADLGRRGCLHVLCEGGLGLAASLARLGLVDEWLTVLAPKVIGTGRIAEAVKIARVTCLQDW